MFTPIKAGMFTSKTIKGDGNNVRITAGSRPINQEMQDETTQMFQQDRQLEIHLI
jgi:hypothetical protein